MRDVLELETILHSHPELEISFKFIPKILISKECIHIFGPLCIYSTNIVTEYFKCGIYSLCLSLQNAVCFIILAYLVPVFTFFVQGVLKLKNNQAAKD